jgi:DNA replication and repair protein RecF
MSDPLHAITALHLENFRNYRSLALSLPPRPVVLRGHNGAGKTNILEAISLLAPGRGFRNGRYREMDALESKGAGWVVAAEVTTRGEKLMIGTARDSEAAADKRILKIGGEKIRAQSELSRHVTIQWVTPAMDQVFVEGGTARRKLLDRIVYSFEPEHAARVAAYETAMRERNRLLVDRIAADPYWLSVLEQQMAEQAVAITMARLDVVSRLQQTLAGAPSHFPHALISLEGTLESWIEQGDSALEVETKFAKRLMDLRVIDGASGRVSEGPQRSRLQVIHKEKNMQAEHCSTGEQKALLLAIILGAARARASWFGTPPILLLDEVIAHLDVDKRASLFDLIRTTEIQAWMTGTDAADFQGLEGDVTILEITGGTVRMC